MKFGMEGLVLDLGIQLDKDLTQKSQYDVTRTGELDPHDIMELKPVNLPCHGLYLGP